MLREDCHSRGTAWMLGPTGEERGSGAASLWLDPPLLALELLELELDCATAEAADN
jgi:hypothetical protein